MPCAVERTIELKNKLGLFASSYTPTTRAYSTVSNLIVTYFFKGVFLRNKRLIFSVFVGFFSVVLFGNLLAAETNGFVFSPHEEQFDSYVEQEPEWATTDSEDDSLGIDFDCNTHGCEQGPAVTQRYFSSDQQHLNWSQRDFNDIRYSTSDETYFQERDRVLRNEWAEDVVNNIPDNFDPDELITVSVSLQDEVDTDLRNLQGLTDSEREDWIDNRYALLENVREDIILDIQSVVEDVTSTSWLVNDLVVVLEASNVPDLLSISGVDQVFPGWANVDQLSYHNEIARVGTRAQESIELGYTGDSGGLSGGRIRLGNLEWNSPLICNLSNWDDSSGSSRLQHAGQCQFLCSDQGEIDDDVCTDSLDTDLTNPINERLAHGTITSWIMAGGLAGLEESDRDYERKYGYAHEADLYYQTAQPGWLNTNGCAIRKSIEELVEQGVDVIAMNFGLSPSSHEPWEWVEAYNPCNITDVINNASLGGTIFVAGTGNYSNDANYEDGDVTVTYPAQRYNVMAVGALGKVTTSGDSYRKDRLFPSSGQGGIPAYYANDPGVTTWIPGVDLIAPGETQYWPSEEGSQLSSSTAEGTSFAGPAVAAILGMNRQWLMEEGFNPAEDAHQMLNHGRLLGDGWVQGEHPGGESYDGYSEFNVDLVHWNTGFGKVRTMSFDSESLGNARSYRSRQFSIDDGEVATFPLRYDGTSGISSSITGGKAAASIPHSNDSMAYVPKISFKIIDKCFGTSNQYEVVAESIEADGPLKSIRLDDAAEQIEDRCLFARIEGEEVLSPANVNVASVLYSHDEELF